MLPALVNLAVPYRLTAAWTSPNWALLPIVLYGSRALLIDERVTARAGLATLAVTLAILIASPIIACVRLTNGPDPYRPHFQQVAEIGAEPRRAAGRIDLGVGRYCLGPAVLSAQGEAVDDQSAVG